MDTHTVQETALLQVKLDPTASTLQRSILRYYDQANTDYSKGAPDLLGSLVIPQTMHF